MTNWNSFTSCMEQWRLMCRTAARTAVLLSKIRNQVIGALTLNMTVVQKVHIVCLNGQSMCNKPKCSECILLSYDTYIAFSIETWLHADIPDTCIFPPSYCYRKGCETKCGGTAIRVKCGLSPLALPGVDDAHENVLCKVEFSSNIAIIARVHRSSGFTPEFLLKLYDNLEKYNGQSITVYGYFNLPSITWVDTRYGSIDAQSCEVLFDMLLTYNVHQTALVSACVTGSASSILDLLFRSNHIQGHVTQVHDGISDHNLAYFSCVLPWWAGSCDLKPLVKNYSAADDVQIAFYLEDCLICFCNGDALGTKCRLWCHHCIENFIPDDWKTLAEGVVG